MVTETCTFFDAPLHYEAFCVGLAEQQRWRTTWRSCGDDCCERGRRREETRGSGSDGETRSRVIEGVHSAPEKARESGQDELAAANGRQADAPVTRQGAQAPRRREAPARVVRQVASLLVFSLLHTTTMASPIPLSPSFASLSTAPIDSSNNSDELLPTPKVRFDHECVLIPDPTPVSRLPRLVTKSYSLPLWKRKRELSVDSEPEVPDDHVVFKVSVPRSVHACLPSLTFVKMPNISNLSIVFPSKPALRPATRTGLLSRASYTTTLLLPRLPRNPVPRGAQGAHHSQPLPYPPMSSPSHCAPAAPSAIRPLTSA